MVTLITAWPIDEKFQREIGIFIHSLVPPEKVGSTLQALIEAGYVEIHASVECYTSVNHLAIHCRNTSKGFKS